VNVLLGKLSKSKSRTQTLRRRSWNANVAQTVMKITASMLKLCFYPKCY